MNDVELTLGPTMHASGSRLVVDGQDVSRMVRGVAVEGNVNERTKVTVDFQPAQLLAKLVDVEIIATFGGLDPHAMIDDLERALYGSPMPRSGEKDEARWRRIVDRIGTDRRRRG